MCQECALATLRSHRVQPNSSSNFVDATSGSNRDNELRYQVFQGPLDWPEDMDQGRLLQGRNQ